jgi:hypothetical protein
MLKVRSSAWSYLETEMNSEDDVLVLVRSGASWMAGVLPRDFPGTPANAFTASLGRYTVLIPQTEQLDELRGRTLQCESNVLAVV